MHAHPWPRMANDHTFGSLVLLLLLGLPLVVRDRRCRDAVHILLWGPHALPILANRTYMAMDMFLLVAVPVLFMGAMLQRCGIAEDMYELMYHWWGAPRRARRRDGAHLHDVCGDGRHQWCRHPRRWA